MQQHWLTSAGHKDLVCFFLGWSLDRQIAQQYRVNNADYLVCYDYTDLNFDTSRLGQYRRIKLVAWSLGVWAAQTVMATHKLTISQAIAVNGTPTPLDQLHGISPSIMTATANLLTEASRQKFYRRMCADSANYAQFKLVAPTRSTGEVKNELLSILTQQTSSTANNFNWDLAVIGKLDKIFTPANQMRAWQQLPKTKIVCNDFPHYHAKLFEPYLKFTE